MSHCLGRFVCRQAKKFFIGLAIFVNVYGAQYASAESVTATEYQVKAVFLYNFAKFVEWPDKAFLSSTAPINICILGSNPFENSIEIISDKSVQGRMIKIIKKPAVEDLDQCHIIFISESEKSRLANILGLLDDSSVLTVADTEGFIRAGGMINLIMQDKQIRFEINLKAARKANLKISSHMLKLAVTVLE